MKALSLALLTACVLLLSACGGNPTPTASPGPVASVTAIASPTTAPTALAAAEPTATSSPPATHTGPFGLSMPSVRLPAISLPHVKLVAPRLPLVRDPKRILAAARVQSAILTQWLADGAGHVAVYGKGLTATLQREVRRLNTNTHDVIVAQVVGPQVSHTTIVTVTNRLNLWYDVRIDAPTGLVSSDALPFTYAHLLSPKERLLLQFGPTNGIQAITLRLDPTTPKALLLDTLTLGCELPSLLPRQERTEAEAELPPWLRTVMVVGRFTCMVVQGTIAIDADPDQAAVGLASLSQALNNDPHLAKLAHVVGDMQAMATQPSLGTTISTTIVNGLLGAMQDEQTQEGIMALMQRSAALRKITRSATRVQAAQTRGDAALVMGQMIVDLAHLGLEKALTPRQSPAPSVLSTIALP